MMLDLVFPSTKHSYNCLCSSTGQQLNLCQATTKYFVLSMVVLQRPWSMSILHVIWFCTVQFQWIKDLFLIFDSSSSSLIIQLRCALMFWRWLQSSLNVTCTFTIVIGAEQEVDIVLDFTKAFLCSSATAIVLIHSNQKEHVLLCPNQKVSNYIHGYQYHSRIIFLIWIFFLILSTEQLFKHIDTDPF